MTFNKNFILKIPLSIMLFMIIIAPKVCGDNEKLLRKVGISASFQGPQLDFTVPIWVNESNVIMPSLHVVSFEKSSTEIGFGFGYRRNIRAGTTVPYAGVRLGAFILLPDDGEGMADYFGGPFLGGEYFFNDVFSAGVEAQINITKSDKKSYRFGNPGNINVNTATSAYVTFYFL